MMKNPIQLEGKFRRLVEPDLGLDQTGEAFDALNSVDTCDDVIADICDDVTEVTAKLIPA